MKINNNLDKNSKAIDIFKQRDFLVIFKRFIISLEKQDKFFIDYKFDTLLEILKSNDFKNNLKSKNNYNLFQVFWKFFSDPSLKQTFIIYVQQNHFFQNINQKYLNTYLDIFDYLEELFHNYKDYPKDIFNISEKYKEKMTCIVWKRVITDQKLFLKSWYPISIEIDDKIIHLKAIDLNNSITFNNILSKNIEDDIKYRLVYDMDNNSYYEDITWDILYDDTWDIITYIDMESIKYFVDKKIFTYTNNNWENCIWVIDLFWFWNIERHNWQDFVIYNKSYFDEKTNQEIKLDYIKITDNWETILYNSKLEDLSVFDLVLFLESNEKNKKYIEETLEQLKERDNIKDIYAIHNFNGKKFVELELAFEIQNDYWDVELVYERCVIDDSWVIVEEKQEKGNIQKLLNEKDMVWKTFVSFSYSPFENTDWFIDANWIVLKYKKQVKQKISISDINNNINLLKITKEENIFSIEQTSFILKGEKYFKINGDDIISETNLKKILESYTSFEDWNDSIVEIYLDETIQIDWEDIFQITAKLDDTWIIEYFANISGRRKKIEKLVLWKDNLWKIENLANDIFKREIFIT